MFYEYPIQSKQYSHGIQIYTLWLIFAGPELDRDQVPLLNTWKKNLYLNLSVAGILKWFVHLNFN